MTEGAEISMNNYIQALQKKLEAGNATEHTHRTAPSEQIVISAYGWIK